MILDTTSWVNSTCPSPSPSTQRQWPNTIFSADYEGLLVRICFGIRCCEAICLFSSVVYPDKLIVSIRSSNGGGIVSRLFAVAIKRTLLRSIGMLT